MTAVEFQSVSKTYPHHQTRQFAWRALASLLKKQQQRREPFFALRDVSFRLEFGEGMAVVGPNGAGKSTLLTLVAGLTCPESGRVAVNGRVVALMELGSGFHIDLTGRENVFVNAALLGLSRREVVDRFEEIVEFSGVREFIDQPLRTYSSGMTVRLAFAVAVNINPDILIIDEVLAVGDQAFQAKCIERLYEMRRAGKTLLAVSHGTEVLKRLCDRALWLDGGKVVQEGPVDDVLSAYSAAQSGGVVRPATVAGG